MLEDIRFSTPADVATSERGGRIIIVGYAAVFDALSNPIPDTQGRPYREVIRRGAFADSVKYLDDVVARANHSDDGLLGRTRNHTLRLSEDAHGLRYEIDPPNTTVGRDIVELIRRGDIWASSFAFNVRANGDLWRYEGDKRIRELRNVRLIDIAPVVKPAYPQTSTAIVYRSGATERMRMRLAIAERTQC